MLAFLPALTVLLSTLIIVSDLYARRVPNVWLAMTLLLGAGMLGVAWMQGTGGPPWPALLGLLMGLVVLLPIHVLGWMGAGDVKFFAVLGFLLGAKALLPIWIIGSLIAGVHATLILLSRHASLQTISDWGSAQTRLSASMFGKRVTTARQGRKGLPYAAWLGVGALITVFNPELMHW
ncbi:prepilin peptidase [Rhodanobacter glycinis]|uniref:Prepilin peptidase n=1 Tax=Rhodanobacter glycinis TaxID=582702 RepID=A0A5B9E5U9_9GAMM|nr:prepilin peptidase [Rhodanobacter glycinis]QEE25861.1 prepilin peptidase [Rhodanobacter glycinis]